MMFKATLRWANGAVESHAFRTLREAVDWAYERAANTNRALDHMTIAYIGG